MTIKPQCTIIRPFSTVAKNLTRGLSDNIVVGLLESEVGYERLGPV